MNTSTSNRPNKVRDSNTSPPAVYAFIFVGTTGLIGFITMIAAVVVA